MSIKLVKAAAITLAGALAFTSLIQGWFLVKNRWVDTIILLVATAAFFNPRALARLFTIEGSTGYWMYGLGLILVAGLVVLQKRRTRLAS